ncbi:Zinc-binding oxidoreductase alcohol dehydrogenase [Kalmusia sp. IMI 367209]|nr:Zinc-binding oxidoreductase alcohol dehydrogenase [Kalmusia sp. IMI 367209]
MTDKMLAVVQRNRDGKSSLSKESISRPTPEDNQVLVRLSHVAQNPTDVQSFDRNAMGDGSVFGCDFAGTVEDVGKNVTRVKKGDTIAGLIWGGEIKGLGAYAEYTVADERICFKVPSAISSAAASTIPLAAATAWLAMFSKECLHIDRSKGDTILIWGGSSSVGLYTIQLARTQNLKVVTTCSPHNFDLVKSIGAHHAFDYSDPEVAAKIKKVEPNLQHIFDTIGNEKSSGIASQALGKEGGGLCTVRPGKANTQNVVERAKVSDVLVWTAFLKDHSYGEFHWPAHKEDHELASELFDRLPTWLENGAVKANPQRVRKGLDAVKDGFPGVSRWQDLCV